jgi:hypothetical protein
MLQPALEPLARRCCSQREAEDMTLRSIAAAVCATAIIATSLAMPAHAREKKDYRYDERRYVGQSGFVRSDQGKADPLSLDGRNLGRTRTCWYDIQKYDPYGVPIGPYCH